MVLVQPAVSQTVPRIIQLKNGVVLEGQNAFVPAISEGLSDYGTSPGADRIELVDDGLRRIFFNIAQVQNVADSERNEKEFTIWQNVYQGAGAANFLSAGPFDEFGHRVITVQDTKGTKKIVQGITLITPRYVEVQSIKPDNTNRMREYTMRIGTGAIPLDVLRSVLRNQIADRNNPSEYQRIVDFWVQSERFAQASQDLHSMQKRFPELAKEIGDERLKIRQAEARYFLGEIRLRISAGQRFLGGQMADKFRKQGVSGEILAEYREVLTDLKSEQERVENVRRKVLDITELALKENVDAKQIKIIRRFQNDIETELDSETVSRMDAFLQSIDDGSKTVLQKLSRAISGWLQGSNFSDENFAIVQSLYPIQDLVREYLVTDDKLRRSVILNQLKDGFESVTPRSLAPMIATMKPVDPPKDLDQYTGAKPIEFDIELPGPVAKPEPTKHRCLAHLPTEYNPNRKYPLVITLKPNFKGITAESQLKRFYQGFEPKLGKNGVLLGPAARYGYIVVSVDWTDAVGSSYGHSNREHAIVHKALRESLRKFSVDSDRVFLHGNGDGATAAYDMAISHPHLWAGVVGISGHLGRYVKHYKENKHPALAVYCVLGQNDRDSISQSKSALNQWLHSDNFRDCIYVEYKGRGNEAFSEEMPEIFKWMSTQRRPGLDRIETNIKVKSIRPWDNQYWFYTLKGFPYKNVTWPQLWRDRGHDPIEISCKLRATDEANFFTLGPSNKGTGATLFLSPEFFDFNKRIEIRGRNTFRGFVKPNNEVMLEDVRIRADVQHPYWAKMECEGKTWMPNFEKRNKR